MLNRVLLFLTVAVLASSCLDKGKNYSASYKINADFEYGEVFHSDSLMFDKQYGYGFAYRDLSFFHKLNENKTELLGGFILSRLKGSGTSDEDRFRVNKGVGNLGSSCYLVYYSNPDKSLMPAEDMIFTSSEYGTCSMVGCYVNNTKEVVNAINGSFEVGDSLAVKMTGYLEGQKTGEGKFLLAKKYPAKDSLVTDWKAFNLTKLGSIDAVKIEMISTRNDIPKAFCLDNMLADVSISY